MMITLTRLDGDGESGRKQYYVGVDIGKSVNSTVISAWSLEKSDERKYCRLIYIEEINAPELVDMIFHTNVNVSWTLPQSWC